MKKQNIKVLDNNINNITQFLFLIIKGEKKQ